MKNLYYSLVLVICFSNFLYSQNARNRCPEMSIETAKTSVFVGETVVVKAILDPQNTAYEFEWTFGSVVAFSGQNTSMIEFSAPDQPNATPLSVLVRIKGLPEHCSDKVVQNFRVHNLSEIASPFLKLEDINSNEERHELDGLFVSMQSYGAVAFVLIEITENKELPKLKARISRIKKHIIQRQLNTANFAFKACRGKSNQTSIWLVANENEFPAVKGCEIIDFD